MYRDKILGLARNYINYITKLKFLPTFKVAFNKTFILKNISLSFRGARLILFNLEVVISKLNVRLYTPTPPTINSTLWESKTLSNAQELES